VGSTNEYHEDMPDKCPPSHSKSAPLVLYRAGQNPVVEDSDCQSLYERKKARGQLLGLSGAERCQSFGLSVFTSIEDVKLLLNLVPRLGPYVFKCNFKKTHGKFTDTPSKQHPGHHTLWLKKDAPKLQLFEAVDHVDNL